MKNDGDSRVNANGYGTGAPAGRMMVIAVSSTRTDHDQLALKGDRSHNHGMRQMLGRLMSGRVG